MYSVGTCPSCKQGERGIRICRDHALIVCDECEATWLTPEANEAPGFLPQPDLPSPIDQHPVFGNETHWANEREVKELGWLSLVKTEIEAQDPDFDSLEALRLELLGGTKRLAHWSQAISESQLIEQVEDEGEAVVLACQSSDRAEAIRLALEAGRHVLAPLPWGDLKQTRNLIAQAEAEERCLGILNGWTAHPRTSTMKSIISENTLGEFRRVIIASSDMNFEIEEELSHAVSLLFHFGFDGGELESVTQNGSGLIATFLSKEPSLGIIDIGRQMPRRQWIEIVGAELSLVCDDIADAWTESKTRFWIHGDHGKSSEEVVPPYNGYRERLLQLFRAIRTGKTFVDREAIEITDFTTEILARLES